MDYVGISDPRPLFSTESQSDAQGGFLDSVTGICWTRQAKHGSDTEIYTGTGEFDLDRFEYMWYMYTTQPHTHITFKETLRMVKGDRKPLDPVSTFAGNEDDGWVSSLAGHVRYLSGWRCLCCWMQWTGKCWKRMWREYTMYVIQSEMGNLDNSVRGPCSGSLQSATRKRRRTRQENAGKRHGDDESDSRSGPFAGRSCRAGAPRWRVLRYIK